MANIATNPTATTVSFAAPRQLSDQNSQGTQLGVNATDLVGAFSIEPSKIASMMARVSLIEIRLPVPFQPVLTI